MRGGRWSWPAKPRTWEVVDTKDGKPFHVVTRFRSEEKARSHVRTLNKFLRSRDGYALVVRHAPDQTGDLK